MKIIYLTVIALICLETNAMERVGKIFSIKRTKTWQDLEDFTEPLLSEVDICTTTASNNDLAFPNLRDAQVLHTIDTQSKIQTLNAKTSAGKIYIEACKTSILELPEAQEDPLKFIHENPISAKIKGKITVDYISHFAAEPLVIYTDFEISSIHLDPKDILLSISGSTKNTYKLLIYRLTLDLKLLKLKYLEAQTKQCLEWQKDSFFFSYRSNNQEQSPSKSMSLLQRLGISKPAPK